MYFQSNKQSPQNPITQISKDLGHLLKYRVATEGLKQDEEGYVLVSDILKTKFYKSRNIDSDKIRQVVQMNSWFLQLKEQNDASGNPQLFVRAKLEHAVKVLIRHCLPLKGNSKGLEINTFRRI